MEKALVMNSKDNVATAITELNAGEAVSVPLDSGRLDVKIREAIRFGHKFAIKPISKDADVVKYGESIGRTTLAIDVGQRVHTHNVESMRGRGDLQ